MKAANGNGTLPQLPNGWDWRTMGEVARVVGGSTPKSKEPSYWGGDIAWVGVADLTGYRHKYIASGARSITQDGYDGCATQMLPAGTVLFSSRAPIGYVAIAANDLCTSQGFKSFVLSDDVQSEYVYWWLKYARPIAESLASGTTFKELSGRRAAQIPIPVPPLDEQRAIVNLVDEAMEALDRGDEALVQALAKAQQLRDRVAERVVTSTATRRRLGELLREPLRNGHSATASGDGTGVRTLTLTAVTTATFVDENTKLTTADPLRVRHLWLEPGDILVQRSNTPELVGSAALYSGERDWAIFPDLLIRVRADETILPQFLIRVLQAPSIRRYVRSRAQGIAGSMPKISQGTLEDLEIPVPPLPEQATIVESMTQSENAIAAAVRGVHQAEASSASLRTAVLRAAFTGSLGAREVFRRDGGEREGRVA